MRLAGVPRARLGRTQPNGCIVPGSGERPVFQYNPTTKYCGVFWMDTSNEPYPECVKAPEGYGGGGFNGWIPPSCMPAEAPPPTPAPTPTPTPPSGGGLPPGFACPTGGGKYTIVDYRTGDIIAGNVTEAEWPQYVSDMTVLPSGRTCDDDSRCKPICGTPEPPPDYYPATGQCSEGQIWNPDTQTCEATPATGPQGEPPTGLPSCCRAIPSADGTTWWVECQDSRGTQDGDPNDQIMKDWMAQGCVTSPESAPAPTPAPAPAPVAPPVTQVSPGASVPIVPRPFSQPPAAGPIPMSPMPLRKVAPQGQPGPSQRPSCRITPYKKHMFPSTTVPTRPDAFQSTQQWTS